MRKTTMLAAVALVALTAIPPAAMAQDQDRDRQQDQDRLRDQDQDRLQDRDRDQIQDRDRIYGSEMMTNEERQQLRDRLRDAESLEERERIRTEHHRLMQERARQKGIALPDEMPAAGMRQGGWNADDPMPGGNLLTERERLQFRDRMRNAQSMEERDRIRAELRARVRERATEQGVEDPFQRRMPSGPGGGPKMRHGGGGGGGR